MKYYYWIAIGLLVIAANYLLRVSYSRYVRKLSARAARFRKNWGKTTKRYRSLRILNSFFYLLGVAVSLTGAAYLIITYIKPAITVPDPTQTVTPYDTKLEAPRILELVNETREAHGLRPLKEDTRLTQIAYARAEDMSKNDYYAHKNPATGKYYYDLFPSWKIKADYSCENLDVEFTVDESQYVKDWYQSTKGHKECMLNKNVTSAGYAAIPFGDQRTSTIYIVVAIHTTSLSTITDQDVAK